MNLMKTCVFFRIDNPILKKLVDSFGEEVTDEDLDEATLKALDLDLTHIGYDTCEEGSKLFTKLSADKRYIQRTYKSPFEE